MDIRLIAMDLDGTTLQPDRATFSPRLRAALDAAHRKGIAVVPITGRQFFILPPAVRQGADWEDLAVLSNGGEVRRLTDGSLLSGHYLTPDTLYPLISAAEGLGLPIELSGGDGLYLTRESWDYQRRIGGPLRFHLEEVLVPFGHEVKHLHTCLDVIRAVQKVNLPYVPDEMRGETERMLNTLPLSWFWSAPRSVEIAHPDASKAGGLLEVCRLLGVNPAQAMALGDSGNDIPMLQCAGLGVAMGNAPPQVQAAADAVGAPCDQDGAARAIEQYILG